ncbi:MAG: ComEC/Rec2 family competence protein [Deltaproteobacteria bacterium]|nr:MAG: ComEC/Rec2 family competence protein [Deltaproteobacteria bacterium]
MTSMFSRPLVPAVAATIVGILMGHWLLRGVSLPVFVLPVVILLCLGITFLIPSKARTAWLVAVFALVGINSYTNNTTLTRLPNIFKEAERITVEGTIYSPPRLGLNRASFYLHTEKIFLLHEVRSVKINIQVTIYKYRGELKVGQRIRFPAKFREFRNFNNPGGFDYRFFMQARGLSFTATVSDGRYVVPMGEGKLGLVGRVLEKIRAPLRNYLHERLPYNVSPIYSALILGERQGVTPELREPFDRAGVGHIMAVSGLHLGLVAWLFYMAFRWLLSLSYRLTLMTDIRKLAAVLTTAPVITYGLIAGGQVSAQRAMIMVLAFLLSVIIGKEKDVWSSLSLAALIILTLMADSLFTASFQLSFIAVAGILWLTPLILSKIKVVSGDTEFLAKNRVLRTVLMYLAGLLAVTVAAAIVTTPLIAYHFNRFSPVALPANLTVVPLIGLWVIPLGLFSCIVLPFSSAIAGLFLAAGAAGLTVAAFLARFWADIPWSTVWVIRPTWVEIVLFYGLLFAGVSVLRARAYRIILAAVLILVCADVGYWVYQVRYNKDLRVTVLDAGRADVAVIQFPGQMRMVIARNAFGSGGFDLGRRVIAPFLWHKKMGRVDYLLQPNSYGQQADKLQFMIKAFRPREVLTNLPFEMMIDGARIRGTRDECVSVTSRGWSLLFRERAVEIRKRDSGGEREDIEHVITRGGSAYPDHVRVLNLSWTGSVTIAVDSKGRLELRGYLKKDLP